MVTKRIFAFVIGVVLGLVISSVVTTPAHADNGLIAWPKDKIFVVDKTTSGLFPIHRAAEHLDDGNPTNLVYVVELCPTGPEIQCIIVKEGSLSGSEIGKTIIWRSGKDITRVTVKLDKPWGKKASYRERLALACHEIGHGIGLDHRKGSTCMNAAIGEGTKWYINDKDRAWLNKAY